MIDIHTDISQISRQLMFEEPFYGLFLIGLNKVIDDKVKTAGVSKNGINCQLTISPKWWNQLSQPYKLGLLKHELLHIVFHHLSLRESFGDKYLFNIAADIEVNQYIKDSDRNPNGVYIDAFPELNLKPFGGTKYYYDELNKDLKDNKGPGSSQFLQDLMDNQQGGGEGGGDMHETWKEFEELGEAERDLIRKQVEHQLKDTVTGIKNRGHIPGELKGYLDKLFEITPPVFDWKGYLRRFIGASTKIYTKKSRRKLNKRYPGLPAIKIKLKNHILVAVDTSGSVSDGELVEFFSEIHHMYKTGVNIDVAHCDAHIDKLEEYTGKFDGRIHGRGGTNFEEPVKLFNKEKKYSTLIYLTDGFAPIPSTKPRGQMMWVMSSKGLTVDAAQGFPGVKIRINK